MQVDFIDIKGENMKLDQAHFLKNMADEPVHISDKVYVHFNLYTYLVSRLLCGVGSSSLCYRILNMALLTPVSRFCFIDLDPAEVFERKRG